MPAMRGQPSVLCHPRWQLTQGQNTRQQVWRRPKTGPRWTDFHNLTRQFSWIFGLLIREFLSPPWRDGPFCKLWCDGSVDSSLAEVGARAFFARSRSATWNTKRAREHKENEREKSESAEHSSAVLMWLLLFHAAFPCFMSVMNFCPSCPCCMSLLGVTAACACCRSMLQVHAVCTCCMSLLQVRAACPCFMHTLHFHALYHAACPCVCHMS
jgi:hypothetical protein